MADETKTAENTNQAAGGTAAPAPGASGESKAGEEKKGESKEISYDKLKLPEGSRLEPTRLAEVVEHAKKNKLTPEAAQAILDGEHTTLDRFVTGEVKKFQEQQNAWLDQAKNDKETGGAEFNKNVELARRVVDKYADAEFRKELDTSGFANHPGLLKLMVRLGKAMSEDTLTTGSPKPDIPGNKPAWAVRYPNDVPGAKKE